MVIKKGCYSNVSGIQSYSISRKTTGVSQQLSNGLRLVILVHIAKRSPKATMHVPAEHDILALTKTTAAVACLETSCTMVGTVSRRRLLYFRDHLAVFFGTSLFEWEAGFAAAVRMSIAATGSGLTLLLLPHCRDTEKQDEKEES